MTSLSANAYIASLTFLAVIEMAGGLAEVEFVREFAAVHQLSYVMIFVDEPAANRGVVRKYVKELGSEFTAVVSLDHCSGGEG